MDDIEEYEINDAAHDRLISAVSKLDKTQHIKVPTRSEPTNLNSEFNLHKSNNKLDINNVVKVLEGTAQHVQISKKLKNTQNNSRILQKPLEKPQAERVKRSTGYEEAKDRVGRWDAVVARSRTLDCVYFPLKRANNKLQPTGEFLSKFELKSPLEMELEEVDPQPVAMEEEEEPVYPLTYQEMLEQRKHLAKVRAQQSFQAAKAKRQSKIKSKKYHRILKKEKLKQQLKEFEELQKTDPEEALKKLDALEKERALERHTLRHKNTGKWAKSKLVRAKYDRETRQELAEQLSVARNLTKKVKDVESSDDDVDENYNPEVTLSQDPMNPWMMQRSDKSNVDAEYDFGYKKYLKDKTLNKCDDSESDSNSDNENDDSHIIGMPNFTASANDINDKSENDSDNDENESNSADNTKLIATALVSKVSHTTEQVLINNSKKANIQEKNIKKVVKQKGGIKKQQKTKLISTTTWFVESINQQEQITDIKESDKIAEAFDSLQSDLSNKISMKLKQIRDNFERQEKIRKTPIVKERKDYNGVEYLQFKTQQKAIIDEELNESTSKETREKNDEDLLKIAKQHVNINKEDTSTGDNIDPSRFIQATPKYLNSALSNNDNDLDQLDDDEQVVPKVNIEDIFEDDDVVASFRQEKEDEANKDKVKDIDLTLPGWGSWGGKGVKAHKRKKNRFIMKGAVKLPRRDENKGDIIIKEYNDPKLSAHKIKEVPFPFKSVKDFEASIRAPLGNTFVTENAHRKLVRPSKITRAGTIIEPMDEEELLSSKNVMFKKKSVIQLLAKNKKLI